VNNLDHAGHNDGVGSEAWLNALAFIDELIRDLLTALPKETKLFVTADHGMINVEEKLVLGRENDLLNDVALIGGEPRARHLYVRDGSLSEVADRYKTYLGNRVDLYTKESIHELIGSEISLDSLERLGDLIVVPKAGLILIDPAREAQEGKMIGHHGGITKTEVEIPLLSAQL
jgi:hypothetical protein